MINKLTLLFLLIGFTSYGQTGKITVKKPLTQDKMTTVVTLAGLYYGACPVDKVLQNKKLKLSNSASNIKILNFEISVSGTGGFYEYACKSDTLSDEVIEKINSGRGSKKITLYISPIRAIVGGKDTLFLNPIEIYLIN